MTHVLQFFNPSATVYGQRPKFFRAEHSATAEGENWAYGPTLALVQLVQDSNYLPTVSTQSLIVTWLSEA